MVKSLRWKLISTICLLSLISCGPEAEAGYQPPIIPVRVSINSSGDLRVELVKEIVTPVGTFDLGGGMTIFSIRGDYDQRILLVRVDEQAVVYKLEEGKSFNVTFNDNKTLYKKVALNYESDGDIVLELESVGAGAVVPVKPINESQQTTLTDTFYDLPEDGEVLVRFCTDDWQTCKGKSEANASWQDIEVATIGGGKPSDGYLIQRFFLFFDTTSIPSNATINSATLYIYAGEWLNGNTTIHVADSTASIPLTTSSYQKFSDVSGGSVTLTLPFNWYSIDLNNDALGWVKPNGTTKLALIHENDLYNIPPTEPNDVLIATGEDRANRPYLVISYSAP